MDERIIALLSQIEIAKNHKILEIGPGNRPTFHSFQGMQVDYLDYMDKKGLVKFFTKKQKDTSRIPEIKYAILDFKEYPYRIKDKYDLIIANHVIEHICNPIGFLNSLSTVLTERGCIFLSVPDKRYTFDFLRKISSYEYIYDCFLSDATMPSFEGLFDMKYNSRHHLKCKDFWSGRYKYKLNKKERSKEKATDIAKKLSKEKRTCHNHCHVYTSKSFYEIFSSFTKNSIVSLTLNSIIDVPIFQNEFYCLFKNNAKDIA